MKNKAKTILFVDDEQIILDVAEFFFKNSNHKLLLANSGKVALSCIKKEKIDIIFLDLMMPEMDGFEVLTHLKTVKNSIPIVIQSGIFVQDDIERTKTLGAIDFVSKPYDMKDIERLIVLHSK